MRRHSDPSSPARAPSPPGRFFALGLIALFAASCVGGASPGTHEDPAEGPLPPFQPPAAGMQLLTGVQYTNAIEDILGPGLTTTAAIQPGSATNGFFSIGASNGTIAAGGVREYETAAYEFAAQALAPERRDALVPCTPSGVSDAACAEEFVRAVGRRFFRHTLSEEETTRYVGVALNAAEVLSDFYAGLEFALAGFLQSPSFLWRVEAGEPGPPPADGLDPVRVYTSLEMASRLSFTLWNSTPDDALLDAAERGDLATDDGLRREVTRLLESERAHESVRDFFAQLLRLDKLDNLEKNPAVFPDFDDALRASAREETLRLVEHHVFEADADYRELFTTPMTFVDARMASHYGLEAPSAPGFSQVQLPADGGRQGLLGHASFLMIQANDENTSATTRGRFVRQNLLCGSIPEPPPGVSTVLPPSDAPTLRERVAVHLMNPGCADCHRRMDPIGLGLENYDAVGAWRLTENGATIDASGVLDGAYFEDAADLGRVIAEHPDVASCFVRSLFRYSAGVVEEPDQAREIARLTELFADSGYRVRALLTEMMLSPGFRQVREPR